MLSQSEAQSYEQQSIRRTLCPGCNKQLQSDEVHMCEECLSVLYYNPKVKEEDDE